MVEKAGSSGQWEQQLFSDHAEAVVRRMPVTSSLR